MTPMTTETVRPDPIDDAIVLMTVRERNIAKARAKANGRTLREELLAWLRTDGFFSALDE